MAMLFVALGAFFDQRNVWSQLASLCFQRRNPRRAEERAVSPWVPSSLR